MREGLLLPERLGHARETREPTDLALRKEVEEEVGWLSDGGGSEDRQR